MQRTGGAVTRELPLIGGFAARVPARSLSALRASAAVRGVWRDSPLTMADAGDDEVDPAYDALTSNAVWQEAVRLPPGSVDDDAAPVAVALLDTGVAQVADLESRIAVRVDLTPDHDGYDRYGHGTHIAGVIAGDGSSGQGWTGAAPAATLVSVKLAGWNGAADVSTVIAGLQWVIDNRARYGIRVLNLSFGTDSAQSYRIDPLDYAVERVWAAGILVVVSAGNRGPVAGSVSKPGDDPYVVTVGAADVAGTAATEDDSVAEFSSRGPTPDGVTKPDLLAPGITIVAPRVVGSTIDALRPAARVGTTHFKGSGTSQAAAIVSGIAARMFAAEPSLTPDEAKAALVGTAAPSLAGHPGAGAGLVDAAAAVQAAASGTYAAAPANGGLAPSSGLGSLEASRGSYRVYVDRNGTGVPELLQGEVDALGHPWTPIGWTETAWISSPWSALTAVLGPLDDPTWQGPTWGGAGWDAKTWSAKTWSELVWEAKTWSAKTWSADASD